MKKSVFALIGLALCGLMANAAAPRLFMGFNYLFGSIPALITLRYYGIFWGTVVGSVAGSYTYVLFGHPYAMVWLTVEPLFLGWMLRRGKPGNLVLYNTLYWPVLGIPLLWIFFKFIMKLPFVGTLPAALMFWFIGITNSLIAQIIMDWWPIARWIGKPELARPVTIRKSIFQLMMVIVLVPAILVLVLNGRTILGQNEVNIVKRVLESSGDISNQVRLTIQHLEELLDDLERHLVNKHHSTADQLVHLLLKKKGILSVWREAEGHPPQLIAGEAPHDTAPPQSDLRSGDVFMTKDRTPAILLLRSLPGDNLLRVIVNPAFVSRNFHIPDTTAVPRYMTITDRNQRIIYTSHEMRKTESRYHPRSDGDTRMISDGVYHFLPPMPHYITLWSRVQRSWYARETLMDESLGWTIIIEVPFAPYQKMLLTRTSEALIVLLSLSLLTLGFSRYFSDRLSLPIMYLAQMTTDLAHRIYEGKVLRWPRSRLYEIAMLIDNFKQTAQALQTRFQQVSEARRHLEARVRERTEALRQAKEQAELVYRLVPSAICVLNLERKILIWNDKAAEITGFRSDEVLGKTCTVFCATFCDTDNCPLQKTGITMPVMQKESTVLTRDGRKLTTLKNIDYLRDAEGKQIGIIESFEDVTERQRMEEQLRHAQKMKAIGTLTGGIAHDFNNMLSIIMGYAELMESDPALDTVDKEPLIQILKASDRARSLTRNLLTFSRPVKPLLESVNLNQVVAESKKLLGRIVPENITFNTHLSPAPLIVFADQGQLGQVLLNLVTNARDAISGDGVISIYTECRYLDAGFCETHGFSNPGAYAVLKVSDTGCGMDEATQERIFEPFYTTKGIGEGTGLGLSITFGIIREQKGHIQVYSEPEHGTTFSVMLPIHSKSGIVQELSVPDAAKGGHETILVAEDERQLRRLVQMILEKAGYEVISADNGAEALEIFRSAPEAFDLVLLDVIMPRLNGRETAEMMQSIRPDVPVIFMSGYTADILKYGGLDDAKVVILQKPLIPNEMLNRIRRILDRDK